MTTELWAVPYLHDWDPDGKVYPEIHAVYRTLQEATAVIKTMIRPEKYHVRRTRMESQP